MNTYQPGDVIPVVVRSRIASGVLVQLEDGRRGVVRRKELSWSRALDESPLIPEIGQTIQAMVLETPAYGLVRLSLRRLQGDPWENARQHYPVGSIVTGQVVNLEAYGAFVELEPGIVGLLHKSEVPGGDHKEIQELLWVGDYVEALVKEVDQRNRRVSLSILERLRKRRQEKIAGGVVTGAGDIKGSVSLSASEAVNTRDGLPQSQRIRRILVVDDDCVANRAFADYLLRFGYEVELAFDGQEALACDVASFDLIFLDLNLPYVMGMELLPQLMQTAPDLIVVLVTGELLSEEEIGTLGSQGVAALLLKPLDMDEVLKVLQAAEKGELTFQDSEPKNAFDELDFFAYAFVAAKTGQGLAETLVEILESLRDLTAAESVILFQLTSISRQVAIVAKTGAELGSATAALPKLWLSVVKNVAVDGQTILENVATTSRRFDTLQVLLPFESCIGIAVPYTTADSRYALFLFDQAAERFATREAQMATAVGYAIAAALREDALAARMRELQKLVLMGQLSSSLLHEIANKLNRVQQQAALLERDSAEMLVTSTPGSMLSYAGRVKERAHIIRNANTYLGDLLKQYQGLMRKDRVYEISVNDLLLKAVVEMSPFADEHKITLDPHFAGNLPRVAVIALRLEQVFLNLMRNAIQLMGQRKSGGVLRIASQHEPQDGGYPIKVRFVDEGPGIHRQRWDWIFEWGTSTREGDMGLGLFVSKGLMESIGGRLLVEQSYMFVGTTFLVELSTASLREVSNA